VDQRLYIKIVREKHRKGKKIVEKQVQHFSTEALSYSEVCYWMREFAQGREDVEDARRSGRLPDLICHSKMQAVRHEMPNASVRQPAEIFHYSSSTLFYVLPFVLCLKFRHWKSIPHFLSDDDKEKRVPMTKF
jgi:hypothetical protein